MTTVYPLAYFVERIGGDLVEVENLIKPGVDAHDFEPTAEDIQRVSGADLLVANGLELEPWMGRMLEALGNDAPRDVIEASSVIIERGALMESAEGGHHGEEEEGEEGEDHGDEDVDEDEGHDEDEGDGDEAAEEEEGEEHHGEENGDEEEGEDHGDEEGEDHGEELDPHVWLDPTYAILQAEAIRDALATIDSANRERYHDNAAALIADLRTLHDDFTTGLASCRHDTFITSHAAYGYLASRYGLEQEAIAGLTTAAQPSPQRLAEIVEEVRADGLNYVLVEPIVGDRLAQTVRRETGVELAPIHAIESVTQSEFDEHGDYMGLMRDNLASLKLALECSS
ncbi:MAG: zinc ABC transporter substrate-binding protein [Chloroflexota bacterium]|nr:zinc ABC transporter substrate-binding protein [Chloroflexota bacterium]